MNPREQLWRRVYHKSIEVYTTIDDYEDHDARLTADAAARGWYANSGWGTWRRRQLRGIGRMPNPGNLLNLGCFIELEYVMPDGEIRGVKYLPSDRVPLFWSHSKQAAYVLPRMKQGACSLPPRRTEDHLARMWAKGRAATCASPVRHGTPPMRTAYPAIQVSYLSDKFTHGDDKPYIHHFGPEVIAYFSSEPFRAGRAPEAFMIRGGRLSLTSHGIDG